MAQTTLDVNYNTLEYKIHAAARDNMCLTLYALLSQKTHIEVAHLLSHLTEENGQSTTPLIIAAKNGHDKVVQMLINFYNVDIELVGTVKFDGFVIEGATPLWCASGAGHYTVVKRLLEHGADVNHPTYTNSTPLRAACFDGRTDIVKFLVSKGADIQIPNKYKNTCLMIACYKGHEDVVCFLLEKGADPYSKAHCGATALHFAAEKGYVEIAKSLIKFGPKLIPNDQGMTALHLAATCCRAEIVEFFISRRTTSRKDGIEALELLGASYANDKDNYDIEKCYYYVWLAMLKRYSNPYDVEYKNVRPPMASYENRTESRTVEEIERLADDENALHMEALMVCERILGEDNMEIPHPIVFRGAVFADMSRFDRCTALWLRAMQLNQKNDRSVAKDLMRFAQVFSQMMHVGVQVDFSKALEIFDCMLEELSRDLRRCEKARTSGIEEEIEFAQEQFELNVHSSLYLLVILQQTNKTKDDELRFFRAVYHYNKLPVRLSANSYTPLHMVCDENTMVDDFHINDVVRFPCDGLVSLLVKCGVDVNAADSEGNTPLHIIVTYNRPISDFITLHNIIVKLLDAGCHCDAANNQGETAYDHSTTGVAEIILRTRRKISLKCIAARAVKSHAINYHNQVPASLEEFISIH